MKYRIIYIGILILLLSCNSEKQKSESDENITVVDSIPSDKDNKRELNVNLFDYSEHLIQKERLGKIQIGMTISEAEKQFNGLRKEVDKAVNFGYGGGSPAYLYYEQEGLVFGLIPRLSTDTILLIIAFSPKLLTQNGLNSNSTVKEISEIYSDIKVNQDIMNGWEFISDTVNHWEFVFTTNEKTVGEYSELEIPSSLKNKEIKTNWIIIK